MANLLRSALSFGGTALGGPLGGIVGAGIGAGLTGLLSRKKPAAPAGDARARLAALTANLTGKAALPVTETETYRARLGEARDGMRESAQGDAARAATLGLAPGTATAAGAGARARALAGVERSATVDASAEQARLQQVAASLLGQEAVLDESEKQRRAQARGGMFANLAGFGGQVTQGLLSGGTRPGRDFLNY